MTLSPSQCLQVFETPPRRSPRLLMKRRLHSSPDEEDIQLNQTPAQGPITQQDQVQQEFPHTILVQTNKTFKNKPKFRICSKKVFLTYSKCDLSEETLQTFLSEKLTNIQQLEIVQETHQDGFKHIHAIVETASKINTLNPRFFDIENNGTTYHPNIQTIKGKNAWIKLQKYLRKEKQPLTYCNETIQIIKNIPSPSEYDSKKDYLMESFKSSIPYAYAQEFWKLSRISEHPILYETDDIQGTIQITLEFQRPAPPNTNKSTLIVGPTGIGKTTWARRHIAKPALWVTHIDNLKAIDNTIKGIIFDDMDFKHWPKTSQIHIVDNFTQRTINVRYGTVSIPPGIHKIFTCNTNPFTDDPAIDRRLHKILL